MGETPWFSKQQFRFEIWKLKNGVFIQKLLVQTILRMGNEGSVQPEFVLMIKGCRTHPARRSNHHASAWPLRSVKKGTYPISKLL